MGVQWEENRRMCSTMQLCVCRLPFTDFSSPLHADQPNTQPAWKVPTEKKEAVHIKGKAQGCLLLNVSLLRFLYNLKADQSGGKKKKERKITILVTSRIHTRWEACHTNQMRQACLASHLAEKTIFPHSLSNKDRREMALSQPVYMWGCVY